MVADRGRSDATSPARSTEGGGGLSDHPVLFGIVTGGYVFALVVGLIAAWAVPQLLGYQLDWTRQVSGLFAADGVVVRSLFGVAFASFPIVFAACTVAIDHVTIRSLVDDPTSNRLGLGAWTLLSVAGLTVLLWPVSQVLPPYGLVRLLSAPVYGLYTVTVAAIVGGVAGVAGHSIPIELTRGRASFGTASSRAVADVRATPTAVLGSSRPVVLGWGVGAGLLLVGSGLLGFALGTPFIGFLLLPVVLVVWGFAAVAFAGGHLRYRLDTVSNLARD